MAPTTEEAMTVVTRCLRPSSVFPILLLVLLIGPTSSTDANVIPESAILFHVQPVAAPDYCETSPLTSCYEIIRHTEETGLLEFDLFIHPIAYVEEHLPIQSLETVLEWTAHLELVSWESCAPIGDLSVDGHTADLLLHWPNCPPMTEEILLAARFRFNVTGYGILDAPGLSNLVLGCPGDDFTAGAVGAYAQAGVECTYCFVKCGRHEHCEPHLDPNVLYLEAHEGEIAEGEIIITAQSPAPPIHCELDCTEYEDWLEITLEELEWPYLRLTVTADASALEEGLYEGKVYIESFTCMNCADVVFTVTGISGVPDDDPDGASEIVSWGAVKARHR
jgi:hypothetical protein